MRNSDEAGQRFANQRANGLRRHLQPSQPSVTGTAPGTPAVSVWLGRSCGARMRLALLAIALAGSCTLIGPGSAAAQDRDCGDFSSQAAAQAFYVATGGPAADPHGLDGDNDGVACETLPCPCSIATPTPPTLPPVEPTPPPEPQPPAPPQGPRRTVEAVTAGGITAELSYIERRRWRDGFRQTVYDDLRVRILHDRQPVYDQPVPSPCTTRCRPSFREGTGPAIRVIDLDGDGRLEVLAELVTERSTDAVGCCHIAVAYGLDPTTGAYQPTVLDTGDDHRPRITGGVMVVQGADRRWLDVLSCPECGYRPIRVWRYGGFGFVDVTRQHPGLIRADIMRLRRHYRVTQRGTLAVYRKGALTPLVGNLCLLDRCQNGFRLVRRAIRRGELKRWGPRDHGAYGKAYLDILRRHLRRTGYLA